MSKIIKITPEIFESLVKDFSNKLKTSKVSDGRINYSHALESIKRTATLRFTEIAWLKMQALVREYDKEVAWHGVAKRGEDPTKDEYIVTDILVYPQEVSGMTVTTDQEEYQKWLYGLDNDVFNNLRMQGHSHVNMSTSPSAVDTTLYENLLSQLNDTMFYVFLIWNKRGEKTIKIYDLAKNILFETADVTVQIIDDGTGVEALLRDAKTKVRDRYPVTQNSYVGTYSGGYNSYSSYSSGIYNTPNYGKQANEPDKPQTSTPAQTQTKSAEVVDVSGGHANRKCKRKKKNSTPKTNNFLYDDDMRHGGYMDY